MFYKRLQKAFLGLASLHHLLEEKVTVQTRVLKIAEAIGTPDRQDYPLQKGKEFLMEANFRGARGQAYTDTPSEFSGPLAEIAGLELNDTASRALFVACLNAVMRHVEDSLGTVHCKNNEPEECAGEIIEYVAARQPDFIGLIGLQPAILERLAGQFGPARVACLDRDEDRFGVPITWSDEQAMTDLFNRADLVLATGSTIVNGSLPEILDMAEEHSVPVYFYGTTVAGAARLMGLQRLCYRPT
jgi:hypothetical protein